MSKEMREQINKVKNFGQFLNEQKEIVTVANIRYADEQSELEPLYKSGIRYVKRHGDTKTAYYELDYSEVDKYGYAPLGKEIPESFFQTKNVNYINSQYYKEA